MELPPLDVIGNIDIKDFERVAFTPSNCCSGDRFDISYPSVWASTFSHKNSEPGVYAGFRSNLVCEPDEKEEQQPEDDKRSELDKELEKSLWDEEGT